MMNILENEVVQLLYVLIQFFEWINPTAKERDCQFNKFIFTDYSGTEEGLLFNNGNRSINK